MNDAGKALNGQSVVVVLFFVGQSHVNARVGSVVYCQSEAAELGKTVRHGEYWMALLGPKPKMGERPLLKLRGPLEGEELRCIFGEDSPSNPNLSDWDFQFGLNLAEDSINC